MNFLVTHARRILQVIGWTNVSLLFFVTPLYTGGWLAPMAPTLFADAGVMVIALWGLVYLAVASDPPRLARILPVLAVEKAFYAVTWLGWLGAHHGELPALLRADALAGLFYAGYGLWDGSCALILFLLWRHYAAQERATA